jgi:hypothetical protein
MITRSNVGGSAFGCNEQKGRLPVNRHALPVIEVDGSLAAVV